MTNLIHQELTNRILKCFYTVYNNLGYGFLEKVYENALIIELKSQGLKVENQTPITVYYLNYIVGNYYADILVENKVIIELKASESIKTEHEIQLVNYLRATDKEIGLLLNFGKKPDFKRKIFLNNRKTN